MLIMEEDQEIQEMVLMEVQIGVLEADQEAFMIQEVQEVLEVILERVQAVQVEVHQAVMTDPTIHLTEVMMEMEETRLQLQPFKEILWTTLRSIQPIVISWTRLFGG
jgi:hypothetical protein